MKSIRKGFIVFLILAITLPGETAHAISFVPAFISHYDHHNKTHHRLSFLDFICEHVGIKEHKDSRHHHQDDCPANHNHALISFVYVIEKKATFEAVTEYQLYFAEKTPVPPYRFSFSEFHSSIWQPPKVG
ncbi:hypothetical protein [Fluviicola chungangensis]|uniref:Uncharacterized protein n=1 Tax=Fluviicola chungangensis TaxID=2597671 RepID=A0A556MN34_9FLAO|nr:hypothetical protein [Fluviicola chungangensis]TSJ41323.1 hypothetical protein FO442_15540 [Fluviicola chungangensis]